MDNEIRINNASIVFLQETRLKERHILQLSRMKLIRSDDGVGTVIGVKSGIWTQRKWINQIKTCNYTATVIRLMGSEILLINIYVPPKIVALSLREDLEAIAEAASCYRGCIVGGDWNAKHRSWAVTLLDQENTNGHNLRKWLDDHPQFTLRHTGKHTYRDKSNLDMFISHGVADGEAYRLPASWCHSPILLRTNLRESKLKTTDTVTRHTYAGTDWEEVKHEVTKSLMYTELARERVMEAAEIDEVVREVTEKAKLIKEKYVRKRELKQRDLAPISEGARRLIKTRRQLVKAKQRLASWDPALTAELNIRIKRLSRQIERVIAVNEEKCLNERLADIKLNTNTFVQIKALCGKKELKYQLEKDGVRLETNCERAAIVKDYLEELYRKLIPNNINSENIEKNAADLGKHKGEECFGVGLDCYNRGGAPELTTTEEITDILKRMNNKKSEGKDGLSSFYLRKMPEIFSRLTAGIFNHCLQRGYFPNEWKKAIIIPLPKKGKSKRPEDLRPISLLSNWGKMLEEVILRRMKNDEDEITQVPSHQFAYRKGHSVVHAIDLLNGEIEEARARRTATAIGVLDLNKAFDSVWTEGLLDKLQAAKINTKVLAILSSFLRDRKAAVRIAEDQSSEFEVNRGVPQGSKLGPVLYTIYVAEVGLVTSNNLGIIQYADDIVIWQKGRTATALTSGISNGIMQIKEHLGRWGVQVNPKKTKFTVVSSSGKMGGKVVENALEIGIEGGSVKGSMEVKYLGSLINTEATSSASMKKAINNMNTATSMIYWLLKKKELSQKVKCTMYKVLIRPTATFGSAAWRGYNKADLEALQVKERKILRRITGKYRDERGKYHSNKVLYKEAGIKFDIAAVISRQRERFLERREDHRNEWYRNRMKEISRRIESLNRTNEYTRATEEWKAAGRKWTETDM